MSVWRRHSGLAAQGIFSLHLRAIGFVIFVLLVIALAIDLSQQLDGIRAKASDRQLPLGDLLLPYMSYRAADIITRLLPMACLIGAFAAELLRYQRLEDVILAAAGTPPSVTLGAMCAVGLATGIVLTALEGWVRPDAVASQVELDLGKYADRFRPGETEPQWFMEGDRAIRARVYRAPEPELRQVSMFEGVGAQRLEHILMADRATPTDTPGIWRLENVTLWDVRNGSSEPARHLPRLDMPLPLTPAHLRYHGVLGFYLPNAALAELASVPNSPRAADAGTAVVRRYAALFLPGVFALLGASLAQAGRRGRLIAPLRLLTLAAVGYVTLVSVKVFWALGEFGEVDPVTASLAPLGLALALSVVLQLHASGYLALRKSRS